MTEIDSGILAENLEPLGEQASDDEDWLAYLMVEQTQSLPREKQLRALIGMSKSRKQANRRASVK
jgi:hypothetical protein